MDTSGINALPQHQQHYAHPANQHTPNQQQFFSHPADDHQRYLQEQAQLAAPAHFQQPPPSQMQQYHAPPPQQGAPAGWSGN
jgi:hypothetical protein